MKRLCILFIAIAACSCAKRETVIVHMTDPQIGFIDPLPNYGKTDSLLKLSVASARAVAPACVVVTGDLVNEPYNTVQDSIYRAGMAALGDIPVWEIPGNHDIMGWTPEKRAHYLDWRGYDRFSTLVDGWALIGFDTNCIKDGATEAEAEQLEWLEAELRKARRSRGVLVFIHCPVICESIDEPEDYFNFTTEKRHQYIDLFRQNNVKAVFAGHTHRHYATQYDGIGFYTAGPVGSAFDGSFSGYATITLKDGEVRWNYHRP